RCAKDCPPQLNGSGPAARAGGGETQDSPRGCDCRPPSVACTPILTGLIMSSSTPIDIEPPGVPRGDLSHTLRYGARCPAPPPERYLQSSGVRTSLLRVRAACGDRILNQSPNREDNNAWHPKAGSHVPVSRSSDMRRAFREPPTPTSSGTYCVKAGTRSRRCPPTDGTSTSSSTRTRTRRERSRRVGQVSSMP